MNLTKRDLSATLKELKAFSKYFDSLIDEFFQKSKTTLKSNKNLKLSGFGSFETYVTKERMGRTKEYRKFLDPISRQNVLVWPQKLNIF